MQWLSQIIKGRRCHFVSAEIEEAKSCYAALRHGYLYRNHFFLSWGPSISLRRKKNLFFLKYKRKSVVFSYSWFLTSLLQRANKTKTLFWHSIRELSSLQWKLHHFKSRLGNHPAREQSGMFQEGTHYKVYFCCYIQATTSYVDWSKFEGKNYLQDFGKFLHNAVY